MLRITVIKRTAVVLSRTTRGQRRLIVTTPTFSLIKTILTRRENSKQIYSTRNYLKMNSRSRRVPREREIKLRMLSTITSRLHTTR